MGSDSLGGTGDPDGSVERGEEEQLISAVRTISGNDTRRRTLMSTPAADVWVRRRHLTERGVRGAAPRNGPRLD
ncbi:hypothetical protein Van01_30010 [Micromonospora andamanensis]|uniref:Uncharacterized protein n=1 Tax=Micromonospora andamanensis TaxID=1287068 RepID=A0ABQ4HVY8_9ACTN|nr:hypothetical protein Van01_30010 [Micromonospora andamanensis]